MTARGWGMLIGGVLALVAAAVTVLFVLQNSARTTQLSLDLGFAAWQLSAPISVIGLVAAAFVIGFFAAVALVGPRALANGRKARRLEQEMALSAAMNPDSQRRGADPAWK